MQISGNYILNLKFGENIVEINPQMIEDFAISQDIDRLLPTFKLSLRDATKLLAEKVPYDKNSNKVQIELCRGSDSTELNIFDFAVKRRNAVSPDDIYTIEGVLDVDEIITQIRSKYFTGNIKTNLTTIASSLGINSTEIGASLSYEKSFLQPYWTDGKLLRYLKNELIGKNQEAGYYCFLKVVRGEVILVFKSLDELLASPVKFNLMVSPKEYEDFFPVSNYRIYDNSQLLADFGAKTQTYKYFNYTTAQHIEAEIDIEDCPTLSEFILQDKDRVNSSFLYTGTGRSNDFTADFEGRVRNDFYLRSNNNIYMWASTWGIQNIAPGDIVQMMFGEAYNQGDLFVYQHSGLWMVKRVVHVIGDTFLTNLMLCRAGIDTDIENSLKESVNRMR